MRLTVCALCLLAMGYVCGRGVADEVTNGEQASSAKTALFEQDVVEVKGAHKGLVRTLAFHPTKALLATGGSDRALRIWKPGSARPLTELVLPQSG